MQEYPSDFGPDAAPDRRTVRELLLIRLARMLREMRLQETAGPLALEELVARSGSPAGRSRA